MSGDGRGRRFEEEDGSPGRAWNPTGREEVRRGGLSGSSSGGGELFVKPPRLGRGRGKGGRASEEEEEEDEDDEDEDGNEGDDEEDGEEG